MGGEWKRKGEGRIGKWEGKGKGYGRERVHPPAMFTTR